MPPLPLIRYRQVRRTERVDSPADEEDFALGRYFQADCLATDTVGMFVYITGPSVLGVPQVTKVDLTTAVKFPAVGMLLEKSTITRCLVIVFGEVAVSPATLTPGKNYWIGADGLLAVSPPVPGVGEKIATQMAGYAIDAGRLLVSPDRRPIIRVG